MSQILFDTLAMHNHLKASGVDDKQAQAIVESIEMAFQGGVATKQDISELKQEILKLEVKTTNLINRQIIWTVGTIAAGVSGIILFMTKFLH